MLPLIILVPYQLDKCSYATDYPTTRYLMMKEHETPTHLIEISELIHAARVKIGVCSQEM